MRWEPTDIYFDTKNRGSPMKIRFAMLAVIGALSILACPVAANAQVSVNIQVPGLVMGAPPPPRWSN